jgi:hypothetical protein
MLLTVLLVNGAPQSSVAGKWDVSVEAARRNTEDGGSVSRSAQQFLLDLTVDGAKATATLTQRRGPGSPWTMSGSWQQGRLELASAWRDIPITNNGKPSTARARYIIHVGLSAETLTGTCELAFEKGEPMPQPCAARRAK